MGKFKHDGSKVDLSKGGGYQGEQPKPAIYPAALVLCEEHESGEGAESTHWVFEITEGPFQGWRGHRYSNDDGAAWVTDQILVALGLQEPGGSYEGTHEAIVKRGGPVQIKTTLEEYNDEKRGKIKFVLPPNENQAAAAGEAKKEKKKKREKEPF